MFRPNPTAGYQGYQPDIMSCHPVGQGFHRRDLEKFISRGKWKSFNLHFTAEPNNDGDNRERKVGRTAVLPSNSSQESNEKLDYVQTKTRLLAQLVWNLWAESIIKVQMPSCNCNPLKANPLNVISIIAFLRKALRGVNINKPHKTFPCGNFKWKPMT